MLEAVDKRTPTACVMLQVGEPERCTEAPQDSSLATCRLVWRAQELRTQDHVGPALAEKRADSRTARTDIPLRNLVRPRRPRLFRMYAPPAKVARNSKVERTTQVLGTHIAPDYRLLDSSPRLHLTQRCQKPRQTLP